MRILYGMNAKLTLRMEDALIETAKAEASRRGKSVSRMVGDFFTSLKTTRSDRHDLPPLTASLVGLVKGRRISEADYKKHLREKYLCES